MQTVSGDESEKKFWRTPELVADNVNEESAKTDNDVNEESLEAEDDDEDSEDWWDSDEEPCQEIDPSEFEVGECFHFCSCFHILLLLPRKGLIFLYFR